VPYLRHHFLDKTFQGLYQVNAFDLALLIPYFIVLIILAAYGAHRYWLVYLYYKHQKKEDDRTRGSFPFRRPAAGHRCSCRSLTSNMWWRGCSMPCAVSSIRKKSSTSNYSTTRPTKPSRWPAFWSIATAALGHPVKYLHRENREGYKAGALEAGLKTAKANSLPSLTPILFRHPTF